MDNESKQKHLLKGELSFNIGQLSTMKAMFINAFETSFS